MKSKEKGKGILKEQNACLVMRASIMQFRFPRALLALARFKKKTSCAPASTFVVARKFGEKKKQKTTRGLCQYIALFTYRPIPNMLPRDFFRYFFWPFFFLNAHRKSLNVYYGESRTFVDITRSFLIRNYSFVYYLLQKRIN